MKRVLVVVSHSPDDPSNLAAPFFFAQSAATAGCEVRMQFVGKATQLLKKGRAAAIYPKPGGRSAHQMLTEAMNAGVRVFVCTASLELNDMTEEDLIDEVDNLVGGTFLVNQGLDADLVLTF